MTLCRMKTIFIFRGQEAITQKIGGMTVEPGWSHYRVAGCVSGLQTHVLTILPD